MGRTGAMLGHRLGALLRLSWGLLRAIAGSLEALSLWACLVSLGAVLEAAVACWRSFGAILGRSWAVMGPARLRVGA
eukprot:167802-Pyramimonas_sp.AAC.1